MNEPPSAGAPPYVSVILPTRRGGALLAAVVRRIAEQQLDRPFEILLIDSGSSADELAALSTLGARIVSIPPAEFDHGATRDRGAAEAQGELLVFLNQDALPTSENWLATYVRRFRASPEVAALQGGIREFPEEELARSARRRFHWDSCGPRFYFTSESEDWIRRHEGIGFSTVNCALRRTAWERIPFGRTPILEDKKWQAAASAAGLKIASEEQAVVWHTHDYDVRALWRRCLSEGVGWRVVGERYLLRRAVGDFFLRAPWRDWSRAVRHGRLRPAELLFPLLRPWALWWGNRIAREIPS